MSGIALATAAVGIGGAILESSIKKKGIEEATNVQTESNKAAIEEQRRQFDKLQEVLAPFTAAGTGAIGSLSALAGIDGPEAEAAAIEAIKGGPEFGALVESGENAILQNASATGGLRGGNVQGSLAQFRPQILSQLINQRFGRLGGVAQLGQASAAGVGAGAINTGQGISRSLGEIGRVGAEGALGAASAGSGLIGDIAGSVGTLFGNQKFLDKVF